MSDHAKEIFLKDYKRPNFWIKNVDLDIDIYEDRTFVVSELTIEKNNEYTDRGELVLNGVDLKLLNIEINGVPLHDDQYEVQKEFLIVKPHDDNFTLTTKVEIDPVNNLSCEGLYKSGDIFCSQNEAEGFRKITYFMDRPDVMASYKTTVRGDKKQFPFLLANGNKVEEGDLDNGRHYTTWSDPFPKPCYLFATVAGDLALVKDTFVTKSGREVALEIYVDHGNEDKCGHAMESLKNSMKWDEDKFGLEYDLDVYMIVAVDSFNMGAMENKGLNIFNSSYVLAKKETATDRDFQGIEGVIGHEYFHNWTGNRVTCRDWFQLTLKEGLTVFRDQEFSSDMLSRPVKRIDDVSMLRGYQFPEDAGPLSHPIKPKSYIEINNFYTATVYEKGSEIIRMIHTILGEKNFRKGMDLYFERHDGQAVTTEDFVQAMSDASGIDLNHFKVWYDQNGTPSLNISTVYNAEAAEYRVSIKQSSNLNNDNYDALYIPFFMSLYDDKGNKIEIEKDGKFFLTKPEEEIVLKNINAKPIPSWNNNFSAPVKINYEYTPGELAILMASDKDTFNQYDAGQKYAEWEYKNLLQMSKKGESLKLSEGFVEAYGALLNNDDLDPAFKAYALMLPSESELCEKLNDLNYDYIRVINNFLKQQLGKTFKTKLTDIVAEVNKSQEGEFKIDPKSMGERDLKGLCLNLLFEGGDDDSVELVHNNYLAATNMTDEIGALDILAKRENKFREEALKAFYNKWENETLVMQKWFTIQAKSEDCSVAKLQKLEATSAYDKTVPNLIRSLVGRFAMFNSFGLNTISGEGYSYFADKILEVDKFNPQIAAGLSKRLNHLKRLDETRKNLLRKEMERILNTEGLSNDTYEVIKKNLG